jgi:cytochrome c oxidase subunit I
MELLLSKENDVRRLSAGWMLLALLALALSTLCAVMLVVARTPLPGGLVASVELFRSALVLHVGLAVIVWFLSCAAGLWTLAAGSAAGNWRWLALALSAVGLLAMMLSLFVPGRAPVLANYVPVLDSPAYLTGLALFLSGIILSGLIATGPLWRYWTEGAIEAWRVGAALSIFAVVVALAAFVASSMMLGLPSTTVAFDALAWGPGHVLQFVHVLLLMSVWMVLAEGALGKSALPQRWQVGLLMLAALPLLAVPLIYVGYPVNSEQFRNAFTTLMAVGAWPAAAVLAIRLLWQLGAAGHKAWSSSSGLPLFLSILLFLLGCLFGAAIRDDSTMVPAHYHGTVGAITLAYMALGYQLLPAFKCTIQNGRLLRWQPVLYGVGLMILAVALAWSGWLGVPRKTLHVDVIVQFPAYFAAMGMAGLGGLLAISGAALFVFNVIGSLRKAEMSITRELFRLDRKVLGSTAAMMLAVVAFFAYWQGSAGSGALNLDTAKSDAWAHVKQKRSEEIERRFTEGVAQLNAKQYEAAASALHRVLELAPEMPEAHVNMGFAMIGLQRYDMARDFFNVAIDLRTTQSNAYYGLAVALEGLHDVAGALGAMRSYVHLVKDDDPYVRKANAAIWEWEEMLKTSRVQETVPAQAKTTLENGNATVGYPIREKNLR